MATPRVRSIADHRAPPTTNVSVRLNVRLNAALLTALRQAHRVEEEVPLLTRGTPRQRLLVMHSVNTWCVEQAIRTYLRITREQTLSTR